MGLFKQCKFCLQYFSPKALTEHFKLAHPKAVTNLLQKPESINRKRKESRSHGTGQVTKKPNLEPRPNVPFRDDAELARILSSLRAEKYANCNVCGTLLLRTNLERHQRRAHPSPPATTARADNEPIGLKIIRDIGTQRWTATGTERCDVCQRRIVWLAIGAGTNKAFEVAADRTIVGTHDCSGPTSSSISVRTVSGGAVESNRRRH